MNSRPATPKPAPKDELEALFRPQSIAVVGASANRQRQGYEFVQALVEIGFLTNRLDEQLLKGAEERDRIAAALVRAALEFGRRYDARRGVGSR